MLCIQHARAYCKWAPCLDESVGCGSRRGMPRQGFSVCSRLLICTCSRTGLTRSFLSPFLSITRIHVRTEKGVFSPRAAPNCSTSPPAVPCMHAMNIQVLPCSPSQKGTICNVCDTAKELRTLPCTRRADGCR